MNNLVRTTITLPQDLLKEAKLRTIEENKNLSLLIREVLVKELRGINQVCLKKAMPKLGKYNLGISAKFSRKEIYADYFKEKLSS